MRTTTFFSQKYMVVLVLFCVFSFSAFADGDFPLKANFDTSKTIDLHNFNSLGFQWELTSSSYTYLQISIDGTFKQSSYGEDGAWGIGWGTGDCVLTFYPYRLQGNLYAFPANLFGSGIIYLLRAKGMNVSDGMEVDVWVRCGDFKDTNSFNEPLSVSNVLKMRVRLVYNERINYPWYIVGDDFGYWSNNPKTIGEAALPLMDGSIYNDISGEGFLCKSSGVFWLESGHEFKIVRNLGSWTPSFCGYHEYIYRGYDKDPDYGNMSVEETGWYEIVIYEKSEYQSTPSIGMNLINAPEIPNYTNVAINDIQMTPVASQKNLIWYAPVTFTEDTPVVFTANNGAITKIPGGNQTDTHGGFIFNLEWVGDYQHIIPAGEYVALFDVRGFYRFYDLQATASYRLDKGIPQPTDDYGTFEAKAAPIIEWSANDELVQVCEMPPLPAGATATDWQILIGDGDAAVSYNIISDGTMSKKNLSAALGEYGHQESASSNNSSSKAPASYLVSANARIYATYNEAGTEYLRLSNPFTITVDTRNLSSKPVDASSGFYLYDSWPLKKDKPFATDDNIHFTIEVPGNIGSFIILPGSTIDMERFWQGTALAPPFAGTNMLSGVLYEKESLWAIEDGWNLPEFSEKDKTYTLTFNLEDMTYEFISPNTTSVKSHKLNDNKTIKDIYNLSGQRVSDNISSLPSGLYIINGRKMVKK